MPDIFINYRNSDEAGIAKAIDLTLARRFGRKQVFYASRSIQFGKDYILELLTAVRGSMVLLAVIGSRWLTAVDDQGRNRLHDKDDWTRREILEAFAHGVPVIPVLVGRTQPRLSQSDLPPELARLANLQSHRLDTHSFEADLRALGDRLAELVPSLVDSDQPEETAGPGTDANRGSTALRAGPHPRQQPGRTNPVGTDPRGSVHGGSGHQFTGDGVNYVEGANSGVIRQKFGSTRERPDDK